MTAIPRVLQPITDQWSLTADVARYEGAVCAGSDPDLWFPEHGGSPLQAIAMCQECPVRQRCLADALDRSERCGVWGGHNFAHGPGPVYQELGIPKPPRKPTTRAEHGSIARAKFHERTEGPGWHCPPCKQAVARFRAAETSRRVARKVRQGT